MEVVTKFALILPEKMRHANSFCFSVYGFGLSQTKTLSETDMPRSYFILSFFSFSLLTIYESTKNLPRRVSHTCFCAHIFNCPKTPRKNPVFFIAALFPFYYIPGSFVLLSIIDFLHDHGEFIDQYLLRRCPILYFHDS